MAEIQTYPSGTPAPGDKVPYVSDPTGSPALKLADMGSLGGWTQVIDESGGSLTNFAQLSGGTFTVDSGAIKGIGTGAPTNYYYDAATMSVTECVLQADVMLLGSNGGDCYAGIGVMQSVGSGSPWHGYGPFVRIQRISGTFKVLAGRIDLDLVSDTLTGGAMDTWFTVRMHMIGGAVDSYINGTRALATRGTGEFRSDTMTLWAYNTDAKWRNIKAWTANTTLPS